MKNVLLHIFISYRNIEMKYRKYRNNLKFKCWFQHILHTLCMQEIYYYKDNMYNNEVFNIIMYSLLHC